MLARRSRRLDWRGGGRIWRGIEHPDEQHRYRKLFVELLPIQGCRLGRLSRSEVLSQGWVLTRFSLIAGLSAPMMSFCAAEVKSASPGIGRYS